MNDDQTGSSLENSPLHLLHRAGQFAGDVFSSQMDGCALTPRQYAVLLSVAESEGISQTGLVARTGIDRSTLADIMRRLLNKGFVERKRTMRDARAYAVRLTEKGYEALTSAKPAANTADQQILAVLSPSEREAFLQALNTIVKSMSEAD